MELCKEVLEFWRRWNCFDMIKCKRQNPRVCHVSQSDSGEIGNFWDQSKNLWITWIEDQPQGMYSCKRFNNGDYEKLVKREWMNEYNRIEEYFMWWSQGKPINAVHVSVSDERMYEVSRKKLILEILIAVWFDSIWISR